MPIQVKDYTWRQTANVIIMRVPLKGIHYSKVDIVVLDNYVKAHFVPFIFELFLSSSINETKSKCTLTEGEIVFELQKVQCIIWDVLECTLNRTEKQELRQQIIIRSQEKAEFEKNKRADMKAELRRQAVREQISLDTKEREMLLELKESEKNKAMKDLELWKDSQTKVEENTENIQSVSVIKKPILEQKHKDNPSSINNKYVPSTTLNKSKVKIDFKPVPFPREAGQIKVNFTPRVFPTPSRESQMVEEEEWLKKQAEARRRVGFVAEDLSPDELDPVWLKEKGDSFFKLGNYLGAISAYSHGIKIGSKMPALYSNRAAAHIALGNLQRAVEDCSTTLELLTPCVPQNAVSRARCHARRGTALCRLGLAEHGLADFEAALKLQPNDTSLLADIEKARALIVKDNNDV